MLSTLLLSPGGTEAGLDAHVEATCSSSGHKRGWGIGYWAEARDVVQSVQVAQGVQRATQGCCQAVEACATAGCAQRVVGTCGNAQSPGTSQATDSNCGQERKLTAVLLRFESSKHKAGALTCMQCARPCWSCRPTVAIKQRGVGAVQLKALLVRDEHGHLGAVPAGHKHLPAAKNMQQRYTWRFSRASTGQHRRMQGCLQQAARGGLPIMTRLGRGCMRPRGAPNKCNKHHHDNAVSAVLL